MEVDQRSIYVGNVSGRPGSRAHLASPFPAGSPSTGTSLPPLKAGWSHPKCFSSARPRLGMWLSICPRSSATCGSSVASVSSPKYPAGSCRSGSLSCSLKTRGLSLGFGFPGWSVQLEGAPEPQETVRLWWQGVSGVSQALCLL